MQFHMIAMHGSYNIPGYNMDILQSIEIDPIALHVNAFIF